MKIIAVFLFLLINLTVLYSDNTFCLTRIKYSGGGDWYNDPEVLVNLAGEITSRTGIKVMNREKVLELADPELFFSTFLYLTGHGKIDFTLTECQRLERHLLNGGFLYIDDDYGIDGFVRELVKKIFPDRLLQEIPSDHEIFHCFYQLPGLPKIHLHDEKPPQAFGVFINGRIALLYTFESNISDGWADPDTHQDSESIRELAVKAGVNFFVYAVFGGIK